MSNSAVRKIGDMLMKNATVGLIHPENTVCIVPLSKVYCW